LRARGVESFISPLTIKQYQTLGRTHENDEEDLGEIEKLAIMVDADEEGYLLQILLNQFKIDQPCFLKLFKEWSQRFWSRELQGTFLNL
jgi:4-hydroxyphenylpyruvate dioxygenase